MPEEWFIDDGGRVEGPVPVSELLARVSPDGVNWSPAGDLRRDEFPTLALGGWPDAPPTGEDVGPLDRTLTGPGPPPRIPGYEVRSLLGAGGCAVVYLARQLALDREVALKTIRLADARLDAQAARLEQEARALARFQHPNIVSVFDSGRHDGVAYFAMERLEGEDLGARIDRAGRLDEWTAWAVARQAAAALRHAAGHGIFHRDVKPSNLFLTPRPVGFSAGSDLPFVKVTDFGIARLTGAAGDGPLTADGAVLGTPVYMAPEQLDDAAVDHRADIYGLGATVYHALAGRPPFADGSVWNVLARKTREPLPRLDPPVSAESADLVAAMTARDPADRVGSYEELVRRIDALPFARGGAGDGGPRSRSGVQPVPLPPAPPDPPAPRRAFALAVAAGAVAAVAGGVGYWVWRTGRPKPEAVYARTGHEQSLFNGRSAFGWVGRGGPVRVTEDDEKTPVLEIQPAAARAFDPVGDFRLTLGVSLQRAAAAEVAVYVADGPDETAPRLTLRVTREGGAALGTRAGADGEWVPVGGPVPFPAPAGPAGRRPFFEVQYAKTGDRWSVWFDRRLVGVMPDDGRPKLAEVRVTAEGGAVLIDTALLEGLTAAPE